MAPNTRLFSFFFVPFLSLAWHFFDENSKTPAASDPGFCAQKNMQERLRQQQPVLAEKQKSLEEQARNFFQIRSTSADEKNGGEKSFVSDYILPVVVHIIHDNGAENISDATVLQGIQDLNDAYANIGYYDPATGVDTKIQFCLAKRNPDDNATTGITRNVSPLTDMTMETDDIAVKDLNRWNPLEYINIWLVREICSDGGGCGVAGYAYFPSSHGNPEDGIVIEAAWFGSSPANSSVIAHEIGHYLGLYHTFEGGCFNNDCLADGDQVCDTPPDQSTAALPCSGSANSCSTDTDSGFASDQDDMFWNYMDYGDWNCYSAFTQGQTDRMAWHIENVRSSLLDSKACLDPCTSPLTASFTGGTTVEIGNSLTFTNTSTNTTTAEWQIMGVTFSNSTNASYNFNQVGYFEICLIAGNTDPNCSDKFCQTIEVTCPVAPEFMTNNFYPPPGQVVNYTNQSANANNYQWTVNGALQATTTNFSFSFPAVGVYDVCLVAGNGLCENEYCLPVFVTNDPPLPGECDTTFLKTYGTPNTNELGHSIILVPDALGGGFLVGGGKGDSAMISLLDANADVVWSRAFDATFDADDYVWEITLDSDNNLIGVGQTKIIANNIEVFAFKYDWQNDIILWLNELDIADPGLEGYFTILEKSPGGNYIIGGQTTTPGSTISDALLLEVDRNTGANVWEQEYDLNGSENFYKTILHNGNLYATGEYTTSGAGTQLRPGITQLNLSGNQVWTKLYLMAVGGGNTPRLFSRDILADNGLVVFGHGSKTGGADPNTSIFLFKTDFSGNLEWAREYGIPAASTTRASRLLNLPDGYLCLGYYLFPGNGGDVFIFKTDKQGVIQWSKNYDNTFNGNHIDEAYDMLWHDGVVLFTGKTTAWPDDDLLLAQLNAGGEPAAQDSCNLFDDLAMTESDWLNPYEGQHNLSQSPSNYGFFTNFAITGTTNVQQTVLCFSPCLDSCDFRPDAVFQSATTQCFGNDSLVLTITVCNEGNFELPEGTLFGLYLADPTAGTAPYMGTLLMPEKVKRDSCKTFDFAIFPLPNGTYYVMLNNDGTNPTPFDLDVYESNTGVVECDYTDNLGSFTLDYSSPHLDLGPDVVMCDNGVTELDAGPGFLEYRWNDGSGEQTFTAWGTGTFWVEVVDSCGNVQADTVVVTIDPATVLNLGQDTTICTGDTLLLSVSGFDRFDWFPKENFPCDTCQSVAVSTDTALTVILVASTNLGCYSVDTLEIGVTEPVFTYDTIALCPGDTVFLFDQPVTQPGSYFGVFPRAEGCDSTHTVKVDALGNLFLILPEDITIELGDSVSLHPTTNGIDLIYQWTPSIWLSCDTCRQPFARPFETTLYTLTVADENGCDASDQMLLTVQKSRRVYIPTAFSPNADGINDVFVIYAGGSVAGVRRFQIFDRWGEMVFEDADFQPNEPAHGWDGVFKGKPMDPAVFVYKAEIEYVDGVAEVLYGDVTLVR